MFDIGDVAFGVFVVFVVVLVWVATCVCGDGCGRFVWCVVHRVVACLCLVLDLCFWGLGLGRGWSGFWIWLEWDQGFGKRDC